MSNPAFKTKYSFKWEEKFRWVTKSEEPDSAKCTLCNKSFRIDGSGVSQIKSHQRSKTHQEKENPDTNQRTFVVNSKTNHVSLSSGTLTLTTEELIQKAEILQALKYVNANYSFASAFDDSERFQLMFPDSEIAKNYHQGPTKIKYNIQFGIAPYVKESLIYDVADVPFSFKFDETTTSKVQKQYDAYCQYWSKKENFIQNRYCGSLFVGHCTNEDLIEHFEHFKTEMQWDSSYLLHLGMDGPNVNLAFQRRLQSHFATEGSSFLDIGTCPLHSIHNGFSKGVKVIDFDLEQFIVDINSFFKLSSARREDYSKLEEVTQLPPHFSLKHSSTRWVTLKKVTVRILEQWENLTEYFLNFLPKQPNFRSKNGLQENKRYQRIKEKLEDELTQPYLAFIAFVSQDFESFLVQFQSDAPLIHLLFPKMKELVFNLMTKFVKKDKMYENVDDLSTVKDIMKLLEIDVSLKKSQLSYKVIDIGTKAKLLLQNEAISEEDKTKFRKDCLRFYANATDYLIQNLPFNENLIRHAQYLNPKLRTDVKSTNAISNLALKIGQCFTTALPRVFCLEQHEKVEDLCDKVRNQWRLYQCESEQNLLVEDKPDIDVPENRIRGSYWEDAFKAFDLKIPFNIPKQQRIDIYWRKVGAIEDESGKMKYPQLFRLVKCVLSISHGNSVPERGFSINKHLLSLHGSSIKDETIVALRMVKDYILSVGGITKVSVNKQLLSSVKSARQRYESDLAAKRRLEEAKQSEKEKKQEIDSLNEELQLIDEQLKMKENGIKVALETVEEGNKNLEKELAAPKSSKGKMQQAQSMTSMGLERKRKLEEEIKELEVEKAKVAKRM